MPGFGMRAAPEAGTSTASVRRLPPLTISYSGPCVGLG
jgi:hypothetical protein